MFSEREIMLQSGEGGNGGYLIPHSWSCFLKYGV